MGDYTKRLRRTKVEDLIHWSSLISLKYIEFTVPVQMSDNRSVFPWDLDSLLLQKVFLGSAEGNMNQLSNYSFHKLVHEASDYLYVRDTDPGTNVRGIIPRIAARQFTLQMDNRIMLFRSMYFYSKCSSTFLSDLFRMRFGCEVEKAHSILLGIYGLAVAYKDNPIGYYEVMNKVFLNPEFRRILEIYSLSENELHELLKQQHNNSSELIHLNHYLKRFCFLEANGLLWLTYPHNLISVISYGTLYILTEDSDDIRTRFGKDVLEEYLYYLCQINEKFENITREITYYVSRNMLLSADVIASKNGACLFVESKSSVVNLRFRDPQNLDENDHYATIYAKSLLKLYKGIKNHLNGHYQIFSNSFEINDCYGVVVNFEDTHIERHMVYSKFISLLEENGENVNDELKKWIFDHMRVIDLYEYEKVMIFNVQNPIEKLFSNKWTDLAYEFDVSEKKLNSEVTDNSRQLFEDFKEMLICAIN